MALTDAEVDAAVPPAGTPDRTLTNAALKELVPFQSIAEVASATGPNRPNITANVVNNTIDPSGDSNILSAPGQEGLPSTIGVPYSAVPDRSVDGINQSVPDDDPVEQITVLSGALVGYDHKINGLANSTLGAMHSIVASRCSHSCTISGSNQLIDDGDYNAISHGRNNSIKSSGAGSSTCEMVGGQNAQVEFGDSSSGFGVAFGKTVEVYDLSSLPGSGTIGRNLGHFAFGQEVVCYQPGMTFSSGSISAFGDAQARLMQGAGISTASGFRRMLMGVTEIHLRNNFIYAFDVQVSLRLTSGLATGRFTFSADVDGVGGILITDQGNKSGPGDVTRSLDPANGGSVSLNTTSRADNNLIRVRANGANRLDIEYNANASGDIGCFVAKAVELQKA